MTHGRGPRNALWGSLPWFFSPMVVSTKIHPSLPEKPNPVSVGMAACPSGVRHWCLAADGLGDGLTTGHVLCDRRCLSRFCEIWGTGLSHLDADPALLDVWAVLHGRQEVLPLVGERSQTKPQWSGHWGPDPNRKTATQAANGVQCSLASWK